MGTVQFLATDVLSVAMTGCLEDTGCFGALSFSTSLLECAYDDLCGTLPTDVKFKTIPPDFIPYYGTYPLREEAIQHTHVIMTHRTGAPLVYAELVCQIKRHEIIAQESKRLWSFERHSLQATVLRLLTVLAQAQDPQLDLSLVFHNVVRCFVCVSV